MVNTSKDNEQNILEAARRVFTKKGMHGARMQEIADEAGINKSLLHYYFRSKDKLFEAVFWQTFKSFLPRIFEHLNSPVLNLEEKIAAVLHSYFEEFSRQEFLPVFIINEIHQNPDLLSQMSGMTSKIRESHFVREIMEKVNTGEFRQVDPMQIMVNILSLSIFPILAKPLFKGVFDLQDKQYEKFLEERKNTIPKMIIDNLKNI